MFLLKLLKRRWVHDNCGVSMTHAENYTTISKRRANASIIDEA